MMKRAFLLFLLLGILIPQLALAADDVVRSGDITVPAGEKVLGNVVCLRGDVDVYGEVFGDVVALAGQVNVHSGGAVYGDVVAIMGAINLDPEGSIAGDQVGLGGINHVINIPSLGGFRTARLGFTAFNIMVRVALAILIGAIFSKALARVSNKIEVHAGACAGAGVLTWLAALPLTVVVALTIIGIPLSLLLLLALWCAYHLGFAALAALIGKRFLPSEGGIRLWALALGAVLLSLLLAVSSLGGWFFAVGVLIRLAIGIIGLGAVTLTKFGTQDAV